MNITANDIKLLATKDILHRAGDQGLRITKVEYHSVPGRPIQVTEFWSDWPSGYVFRVTSRDIRAGETV